MKKINQSNLILLLLACLTFVYLKNAPLVTSQILTYSKLFLEKLFPSSFLFFTMSTLLIEYNAIQKIANIFPKTAAKKYITLMSMISGFPSGSKYTKELLDKNLISEEEANQYIKFTHFPNPVFILGPVSSLFPTKKYSYIILTSLMISNFIISINIKKRKSRRSSRHWEDLPKVDGTYDSTSSGRKETGAARTQTGTETRPFPAPCRRDRFRQTDRETAGCSETCRTVPLQPRDGAKHAPDARGSGIS